MIYSNRDDLCEILTKVMSVEELGHLIAQLRKGVPSLRTELQFTAETISERLDEYLTCTEGVDKAIDLIK